MTKYELYTKMHAYFTETETEFSAEAVELCDAELKALEAAKARNAEKRAERAAANEPLYAQITTELANGQKTASEIAAALEVKVQKASALLRAMVADGKLTVSEVKVKNKGTQKAYALAE